MKNITFFNTIGAKYNSYLIQFLSDGYTQYHHKGFFWYIMDDMGDLVAVVND